MNRLFLDLALLLLGALLPLGIRSTAYWWRQWRWPDLPPTEIRTSEDVIVIASPDHAREEITRLIDIVAAYRQFATDTGNERDTLKQERAGYIAERDALAAEVRRLRETYESKSTDITTTA